MKLSSMIGGYECRSIAIAAYLQPLRLCQPGANPFFMVFYGFLWFVYLSNVLCTTDI